MVGLDLEPATIFVNNRFQSSRVNSTGIFCAHEHFKYRAPIPVYMYLKVSVMDQSTAQGENLHQLFYRGNKIMSNHRQPKLAIRFIDFVWEN